jgi:hypothetical protein
MIRSEVSLMPGHHSNYVGKVLSLISSSPHDCHFHDVLLAERL